MTTPDPTASPAEMEPNEDAVLAVECPLCGAVAGELCVRLLKDEARGQFHQTRWNTERIVAPLLAAARKATREECSAELEALGLADGHSAAYVGVGRAPQIRELIAAWRSGGAA